MPMPGRLKKPPLLAAPAAAGPAIPGEPGCCMVRFIGCAALGAVAVEGGAWKVLEPREPMLLLPPGRASTAVETAIVSGIASDRTTASVLIAPRMLNVKVMVFSLNPRQGEIAPKMATPQQKGSALHAAPLRRSVAGLGTF